MEYLLNYFIAWYLSGTLTLLLVIRHGYNNGDLIEITIKELIIFALVSILGLIIPIILLIYWVFESGTLDRKVISFKRPEHKSDY